MGTISSARAIYGLYATGTPTKTGVANDVQIGSTSTTLPLTSATKAYVIGATLASNMDELSINLSTGVATAGTTPVSQVETATVVAAAGATSNGNLAVTVTGARITGSPLSVSVPLTTATHTAASIIAGAIGAAFNEITAITSVYTVLVDGANVKLQETDPKNNDGTLNIAIAAGLGVSAVTSSTNTTVGVGGVKLTNNTGDGKDFEGISLGTITETHAVMVKGVAGEMDVTINGASLGNIVEGEFVLLVKKDSTILSPVLITASGEDAEVEITVIAL